MGCLIGFILTDGTLDFYEIHTYPNNGKFSPSSPLSIGADKLALDKPVVRTTSTVNVKLAQL